MVLKKLDISNRFQSFYKSAKLHSKNKYITQVKPRIEKNKEFLVKNFKRAMAPSIGKFRPEFAVGVALNKRVASTFTEPAKFIKNPKGSKLFHLKNKVVKLANSYDEKLSYLSQELETRINNAGAELKKYYIKLKAKVDTLIKSKKIEAVPQSKVQKIMNNFQRLTGIDKKIALRETRLKKANQTVFQKRLDSAKNKISTWKKAASESLAEKIKGFAEKQQSKRVANLELMTKNESNKFKKQLEKDVERLTKAFRK